MSKNNNWTRKEVKAKGKAAFLKNYWKTLLVALLIIFTSGGAGATGFGGNANMSNKTTTDTVYEMTGTGESEDGANLTADEIAKESNSSIPANIEMPEKNDIPVAAAVSLGIVAVILVIFITAFGIAADAFVLNPLMLGCRRFFLKNLDEPAEIGNITYGFDRNYKHNVKVLFYMQLRIFLWSLLFIIPGLVKAYEYRVIPYILNDHPEMNMDDIFAESRRMMDGNKWKAFVLDLSFIGWQVLSLFTCGLLSIFYVNPYIHSTHAALYDELKYSNLTIDEADPYAGE